MSDYVFAGIYLLVSVVILAVAIVTRQKKSTYRGGRRMQDQRNSGYQYPQHYNYPPQYPAPTSGMCIAGFVCALVLPGVLGLIFSIIGIKECDEKGMNGKGLGIAGLVISIVKLALIVMWLSCFGCMCSSLMPSSMWR